MLSPDGVLVGVLPVPVSTSWRGADEKLPGVKAMAVSV
jgi:hypothetical protein